MLFSLQERHYYPLTFAMKLENCLAKKVGKHKFSLARSMYKLQTWSFMEFCCNATVHSSNSNQHSQKPRVGNSCHIYYSYCA